MDYERLQRVARITAGSAVVLFNLVNYEVAASVIVGIGLAGAEAGATAVVCYAGLVVRIHNLECVGLAQGCGPGYSCVLISGVGRLCELGPEQFRRCGTCGVGDKYNYETYFQKLLYV